MPSATIRIKTPLYPTESPDKVRKAVLNIFPDAELSERAGHIEGVSNDLNRFREILRDLRIRDSARHYLRSHTRGDVIVFSISKQAAYVGKISFGGNRPALGDIDIEIESDGPERLIEWLTFTGE